MPDIDLDAVKTHPAYQNLTTQEKTFILALVESGGNAPEAVRAAYNCTTQGAVDTMARKVLNRPYIQTLKAVFLEGNDIPHDEFLQWAWFMARSGPQSSRFAFGKLVADMKGWTKPSKSDDSGSDLEKTLVEMAKKGSI